MNKQSTTRDGQYFSPLGVSKRGSSKSNLRFPGLTQKKGVSAVVATVLIVMISVSAVAILWATVIPMLKDNLDEVSSEKVELSIQTIAGYTVYDGETLKVQIKRGADSAELTGYQIFTTDGANTHTLIVTENSNIPDAGQVITVAYKLSFEPTIVRIAPYINEELQGITSETGIASSSGQNLPAATSEIPGENIDFGEDGSEYLWHEVLFGDSCTLGSQCVSENCANAACTNESGVLNGVVTSCTSNDDCLSGYCSNMGPFWCTDGSLGGYCNEGPNCISETCAINKKCTDGEFGSSCGANTDCNSGYCSSLSNACTTGELEAECAADLDCQSNNCSSFPDFECIA